MSEQAELSELARFSEIVQMSKSSAFAEMIQHIDDVVSEAHEALIACMSADPMVRMGLSMRYQQRIAFRREIQNWIDSAVRGHEEILERMKQDLEELAQRG